MMKKIGNLLLALVLSIALFFGVLYYKENKSYIGYIKNNNIVINNSNEKYDENYRINKLRRNNNSIYYQSLNEDEKKMYVKLANTIKNLDNSFVVSKEDFKGDFSTSLGKVVNYFLNDHPEVFYLSSEYKYNEYDSVFKHEYIVTISYLTDDKNKINEQIETLDNKINSIVSNVKSTDEYEIELQLHDYIAKNIVYDYDKKNENIHNVYGGLISKKAVCDGISKSLSLLLERKNIDSYIVVGKIENQPHAWTMVKLNDNYYHTDLTADISVSKSDNIIVHTYLNRVVEDIKKTHHIEDEEVLPKTSKDDLNYYVKNDFIIQKNDNFENKLSNIIYKNRNNDVIEFKVNNMVEAKNMLVNVLSKRPEFRGKNRITYYEIFDTIIIKNT